MQETREHYDLESLWALGPEFDEQSQASEESADDIFYNSGALAGLTPAGSSKKIASNSSEKVNNKKFAKR